MPEIEAKVLEIDPADLKKRLRRIGGKRSFSGELKAIFFDHPGDSLTPKGASLRLRQEGDIVVLTYKSRLESTDPSLKVMQEDEVVLTDFEEMRRLLADFGYVETSMTQKHRVQYELPGAHVVIDQYRGEWGHIPAFCEIEAEDPDRLYEVAVQLGFSREQLCSWNSFELMAHYPRP